jgi:hypothetical protein
MSFLSQRIWPVNLLMMFFSITPVITPCGARFYFRSIGSAAADYTNRFLSAGRR